MVNLLQYTTCISDLYNRIEEYQINSNRCGSTQDEQQMAGLKANPRFSLYGHTPTITVANQHDFQNQIIAYRGNIFLDTFTQFNILISGGSSYTRKWLNPGRHFVKELINLLHWSLIMTINDQGGRGLQTGLLKYKTLRNQSFLVKRYVYICLSRLNKIN